MDGPDNEWSNSLVHKMKKDFLTVRGVLGKWQQHAQRVPKIFTATPLLEPHLVQVTRSTAGRRR